MSPTTTGGRRRLDTPADYDVPTRGPRLGSALAVRAITTLVVAAWVAGTLGSATAVLAVGAPEGIQRPAAAVLMVVFAIGLVHRSGGHMRIWATMAGLLAVLALTLQTNMLIAGAAAVTAVVGAVWSVMFTRPADTAIDAVREFGLTLLIALSGMFAVAAWNAPVSYQRFNLVVLAASLTLAITLVWNLGAGLHGLGRQGFLILIGAAALLLVLLAYSSFVRAHGSQVVLDAFDSSVVWMRDTFGGVPRPVEVVIGFPALIAGVSMRAKRREGWWILVFAVIGTGVVTTSLVTPGALPSYILLSTLYSAVLGLALGLVVRHFVIRERSKRAARAIEPIERSEPPRVAALK